MQRESEGAQTKARKQDARNVEIAAWYQVERAVLWRYRPHYARPSLDLQRSHLTAHTATGANPVQGFSSTQAAAWTESAVRNATREQ